MAKKDDQGDKGIADAIHIEDIRNLFNQMQTRQSQYWPFMSQLLQQASGVLAVKDKVNKQKLITD